MAAATRIVLLSLLMLAACGSTATSDDDVATTAGESSPGGGAEQCDDVVLEANSDNLASAVSVDGLTCEEAVVVITEVAQTHNFYSGPRTFDSGPFECSVEIEEPEFDLPVGRYTCVSDGGASVSWRKS